jgi:hypothetical protein
VWDPSAECIAAGGQWVSHLEESDSVNGVCPNFCEINHENPYYISLKFPDYQDLDSKQNDTTVIMKSVAVTIEDTLGMTIGGAVVIAIVAVICVLFLSSGRSKKVMLRSENLLLST